MAVCALPTVETRPNVPFMDKLNKRFSVSNGISSLLAHFILNDTNPIQDRIALYQNILEYPRVSGAQLNLHIKRHSEWATSAFYKYSYGYSCPNLSRLGGKHYENDLPMPSVCTRLNPKNLQLSSKKSKKQQKECKEYLLHKLKLYVRDNFREKSVACIKGIPKDIFIQHQAMVKMLFLECVLNKNMEEVAVALIDKAATLFDCPVFGANLKCTYFPSLFVVSVALGREKVVERFLKGKKKHIIAEYSWRNIPALVFACFSGNNEIVKMICHAGADPASYAQVDDLARLKGIITKGPPHPMLTYSGFKVYSFEIAAALNNLECVEYLLNKIQRWNIFKSSHFALVVQANTVLSLVLLKAGVPVEQHNSLGQRALHLAAICGNVELGCILLNFGAPLHAADRSGNTALHYAALNKHKEILQYLVYKGGDANAKNGNSLSPLEIALNNGLLKNEQDLRFSEENAAEIESTVNEIIHNPKYDTLVRLKKGFKLNDKIFGALSRTFNLSKTCPPIKDSLATSGSSINNLTNDSGTGKKLSFFNSLTSIFRKKS